MKQSNKILSAKFYYIYYCLNAEHGFVYFIVETPVMLIKDSSTEGRRIEIFKLWMNDQQRIQ
jgi:hypothetical protein